MADVRYEQATKLYSGTDVPAVDALDLEVEDGEFMVLVGPSGSGKTTALRMLAGLEEVDAGAVLIGGRDVTDLPPKKRDVAMVFQNYALYPYLTVSHDQAEAMTLGHRVAVLDHGRLQQVGEPRELYDRPTNRFVAGFIGSPAMNLCDVTCEHGAVSFGGERVELGPAVANGSGAVVLGLRPEALEVGLEGLPARVEVVEEFGADAFVFSSAQIGGEETRLVARTEARRAPAQGERIFLRVKPEEAHLFDA